MMQSRPPNPTEDDDALVSILFSIKTRSDESYLNEGSVVSQSACMGRVTAALLSSLGKCASSWLQASRRRGPRSQQI